MRNIHLWESNMSEALFFHAGCQVCLSAEQQIIQALDPARYSVEVVHLGVKSVPALVIEGQALHVNFDAALADLK